VFDQSSRYRDLPVVVSTDLRGHAHSWVVLRLTADPVATISYEVRPHDRLDLIAARAYADPTVWWRIADANAEEVTGIPHELVDTPGRTIALGQPVRPEVLPK
jgi:nucleoid-associated protein YgaU